ncbi:hypothetical protein RIF29_20140 [Crotalaria pallida]|uniref:Uncharacterized protein n=1 Tax=Crotalaria pallida TaxID=3830 RepID=A0AAN9F3X8_CROPI
MVETPPTVLSLSLSLLLFPFFHPFKHIQIALQIALSNSHSNPQFSNPATAPPHSHFSPNLSLSLCIATTPFNL